ncbi:tRNA uridine-5-carboxymethylaminomethyl(34) synthesis GTPase MnmE [Paenochrobactrum pullorum]|uniref:tRNA uridine-5-carboxymethylaminomethyl(34) synthesis GTPase MnmE n=1 Tax=Paenochrobactrum pullorum TaxID=1324351 RepID=UPI0035BC1E03
MNESSFHDTIFALSSGRLPAGVAVIRVSGPQTRFTIETIFGKLPEIRRAVFGKFHSVAGELLDQGLLIYFKGPASFTGEDCAEFHLHGGVAVVERFLNELSHMQGLRFAEAGEFTRRAFTHGKMDLTIAEGLADLISAETEGQRRLAQNVASGAQRDLYNDWRTKLIQARALIEAELDFADESDVPGSVSDQVWDAMALLNRSIQDHIAGGKRADILRDGFQIVIAGEPNAGKSSLLNLLAGRDVAIISDEAGTTRDLLEVKLDLAGIPVYVTDTAGIRETKNKVEKIGIERALEKARKADLVLLLEDLTTHQRTDLSDDFADVETWRIGTKIDLTHDYKSEDFKTCISVTSGENIEQLIVDLTVVVSSQAGNLSEVVPTRLRHINLLKRTALELENAIRSIHHPLELRAENLRLASQSLGRITGDVDVEDILDVIFSEFCIGK